MTSYRGDEARLIKIYIFEYIKIGHREGGTDYGNKHI